MNHKKLWVLAFVLAASLAGEAQSAALPDSFLAAPCQSPRAHPPAPSVLASPVASTSTLEDSSTAQSSPGSLPEPALPASGAVRAVPVSRLSGFYGFVREGEFLALELRRGLLAGYISRFLDFGRNPPRFVDQPLRHARMEDSRLSFATAWMDGRRYEFSGLVCRGSAPSPAEEDYWELRGILSEWQSSKSGRIRRLRRRLELRSYPQLSAPSPALARPW